jgi:hypothetical protein
VKLRIRESYMRKDDNDIESVRKEYRKVREMYRKE